ncbi:MAG TPA: nucleotidyl transferase AbiEii/AbiGii toxin family protein [Sphingobacterium sp.]|jgi:predicted nucleotidyltransferase component of viral defense system|nr:nucleotidyl transferase AbiEii/AbiGii toxin family protein [Sphingobacterium sp.]
MIKEWIDGYNPQNQQDIFNALREIMQEIALAGLERSGFFEKAAFYGGTALRILHGLDRYSEDLDFSLLEVDPSFSLEHYFDAVVTEFSALGITVHINEKKKSIQSNVDSAFLKSDTVWRELVLENILPEMGLHDLPPVKIKIEIDREPPLGFRTEEKLLIRPFSFYIKSFDLPSLFAGKMHALLFRKWKNRVKGRDWYDLEWYIKKGVTLYTDHFLSRAQDSGDWKDESISHEQILELLRKKIETANFDHIRADVVRFVKDAAVLDIWDRRYFLHLTEKLRFGDVGEKKN